MERLMTIALITLSPQAILGTFPDSVTTFRLPSGDAVEGASVGWTGEGCAVVAVASFVTPAGYENVGGPSYAFDGLGNVVETYATQAIPTPVPTCQVWQLKAVLTAAQTTAVESAIAASPNTAALQAFWATGDAPVPANSTTLLALGAAIGLSAAQVAALVTAASEVSIP
jgi:hypothetical protein